LRYSTGLHTQYFLGIDGGQSSTTALIGDETGRPLGKGVGGPCNHVSAAEGREKLARTIAECVEAARLQAGLTAGIRFRAACVGMSGGPADKRAILAELLPADDLLITDDAAIALAGAMGGEPGVITIAGTGSIAFGRNGGGETARAGGWGYIFGDEGGAFDLVRQALRAALRQEEGWGSATMLTEMLLRETEQADVNAVLHLFYTPEWPRSRVAGLASLVDSLASEGDSIAEQILRHAGQHLAHLAGEVRQQLWPEGEVVKVAYIGGVFRSAILLGSFLRAAEYSGCDVVAPMLGPAAGALLEAYRLAGQPPSPLQLLTSNS
jgi:N-acetylglucosamine kinase-like BadF-type ATPase